MKTLLKNEMSQVSGGAAAVLNPCCGVVDCYYDATGTLNKDGSSATLNNGAASLCLATTSTKLPPAGYKVLSNTTTTLVDSETHTKFLVNNCTVSDHIF